MEIVGTKLDRAGFAQHLSTITTPAGRNQTPSALFLHHTWKPTVANWRGASTIQAMKSYYESLPWTDSQGRQRIGWTAGPHLFVAPDGVWLFTSIDKQGVHAAGHNVGTIGLEMVGDYDNAPPSGRVLYLTVDALARMMLRWRISPSGLRFHRDVSTKSCPGNAVSREWLQALVAKRMARLSGTFGSPLSFHIQKPRYERWLMEQINHADPEWIKVLDPDQAPNPYTLSTVPLSPTIRIVGRLYFDNEPEKQLIQRGAEGAEIYWRDYMLPRILRVPWVDAWEGPNEPDVSGHLQCQHLGAFWARLNQLLHGVNKLSVAFSISTWNPPTPEHWQGLALGAETADFVGIHEYRLSGPEGDPRSDGENLLRYRRGQAVLRSLGIDPEWMVTETGIDRGGGKTTDGWLARGYSEEMYMAWLADYSQKAGVDPLMTSIQPFTLMTDDWLSFRITESMNGRISRYSASTRGQLGDHDQAIADALAEAVRQVRMPAWVLQALLEAVDSVMIPQNPASAFYRYGQPRGWQPVSPEIDVRVDGETYRTQGWYSPDGESKHVVFTEVGNWAATRHFTVRN